MPIDYADISGNLRPLTKTVARASAAQFEPELDALTTAALADLARVGVDESCFDEESPYYPLVRQAVLFYTKAHFGGDNPNAEMDFWRESYQQTVTDLLNSAANAHAKEDGDEVE